MKAIHICNSQQPIHKPKIAKEYVLAEAERRAMKAGTEQHLIKATVGEVVKSRSMHLINFFSGGQVIALNSATFFTLSLFSPYAS